MTANRWHRQSARIRAFDYGRLGSYFITICTHRRAPLFQRPRYLDIAAFEWARSEELRAEIELDAFVVMPNHIHGIVWITEENQANSATGSERPENEADRVGARGLAPLRENAPRMQPRSLGSFVGGYKAAVTRSINALRDSPGAPVWQRNYYEHVIRTEDDLARIRRYIDENPLRWAFDRENLAGKADAAERDFWDSLA